MPSNFVREKSRVEAVASASQIMAAQDYIQKYAGSRLDEEPGSIAFTGCMVAMTFLNPDMLTLSAWSRDPDVRDLRRWFDTKFLLQYKRIFGCLPGEMTEATEAIKLTGLPAQLYIDVRDVLHSNGFIDPDTIVEVENRLFDKDRIKFDNLSGVSDLLAWWPKEKIGFSVSKRDILKNSKRLNKYTQGIIQLSETEITELAFKMLIAHEFGHILLIYSGLRIGDELDPSSYGESLSMERVLANDRERFWDIINAVDKWIEDRISNELEDLHVRRSILRRFGEDDESLLTTFHESICVGLELAIFLAEVEDTATDEELDRIRNNISAYFAKQYEELGEFMELMEKLNLKSHDLLKLSMNIGRNYSAVSDGLMGYASLPKFAGYLLPISPNSLRRVLTTITSVKPNSLRYEKTVANLVQTT